MSDLHAIDQALAVLTDGVFEVRIPGTAHGTVSGYFDNPSGVGKKLRPWGSHNIYVTLNPVEPSLLARSANELTKRVRTTTGDAEIARRRWFFIDIDPRRPSGISATAEERGHALRVGVAIRDHLLRRGWRLPVLGDSGNGNHLFYLIDAPNDTHTRDVCSRALQALAFLFDDDHAQVDVGVFNAARIVKVYGTWARKGSSTDDRPHRLAQLMQVPDSLQVVPFQLVEELAATAPRVEAKRLHPGLAVGDPFDVDSFLQRHGIDVAFTAPYQGGTKWILQTCPWNAEHRFREAFVIRFPSGALDAGCLHNSCRGKRWADLRFMYEPPPAHHGRVVPIRPGQQTAVVASTQAAPSVSKRYLEDTFIHKLPDVVWQAAPVAEYVGQMGQCTEAPDTFHLAGYLSVVGLALGRTVWKTQSRRVFPNLYVALLGDSGKGRKSTALHLALELLKRVDPSPTQQRSIGSAEALIELLAEAEMDPVTLERHREGKTTGEPPIHRRVVLVLDEISNFLVKAHKDSTGSLIQTVVEAFDCPPTLDHAIRRSRLVAHVPTLSFIGCSNAFWLERFTSLGEVLGGFSNRFLYFDGQRKPPMPDPPPPPPMNEIVEQVHEVLDHYRAAPIELTLTQQAKDLWARWYCEVYELPARSETMGILFQRAQLNAIKVATIYAAHDRASQIDVSHLEAGIGIARYSGRVMHESLGSIGDNERAKLDQKILAQLRKGPRTARAISQGFAGHHSTRDIVEALRAMLGTGIVVCEPAGRTHLYRLVGDSEEEMMLAAPTDQGSAQPESTLGA